MYNLTVQIYGDDIWKDAFNHPAIALGKLEQRLTTWGLQ